MSSTRPVAFQSRGIEIAGVLHVPADASSKKNAAVVVAHPMTGVKEQTAGTYAKHFADAGLYALAYDAAYQGASKGEPRQLEDPYQRSGDNRAAVDFLTTLDEVDSDRIGILGICASGGYVSFAAQTDPRMKAVAILSAACTGSLFRDGMPEGSTSRDALKEQLAAVAGLRTKEANGEAPVTNPVLPENWRDMPAGSLWHEGGDYYLTPRAQHPNSKNAVLSRSLELLATYDSFRFNELIAPRPYLAIVGSDADTRYFSEKAIEAAKEPKELFVIPGKTHVKLYDDTEAASKKLIEFMTQHLVQ